MGSTNILGFTLLCSNTTGWLRRSSKGCIIICKEIDEAIRFINEYSPEHLEIMTKNAWDIGDQINSAGLVLIGNYTPVSASDYCLGTDHVLPTRGFSKVYSGVSVLDFVKRFNIVECSREGLLHVKEKINVLAKSEGMINHGLAVEARFKDDR